MAVVATAVPVATGLTTSASPSVIATSTPYVSFTIVGLDVVIALVSVLLYCPHFFSYIFGPSTWDKYFDLAFADELEFHRSLIRFVGWNITFRCQ